MVKKGDLVRMDLGWSGVGVVLDVLKEHPRSNEAQFSLIQKDLKRKHLRVFWTDEQASEILPLDQVKVIE